MDEEKETEIFVRNSEIYFLAKQDNLYVGLKLSYFGFLYFGYFNGRFDCDREGIFLLLYNKTIIKTELKNGLLSGKSLISSQNFVSLYSFIDGILEGTSTVFDLRTKICKKQNFMDGIEKEETILDKIPKQFLEDISYLNQINSRITEKYSNIFETTQFESRVKISLKNQIKIPVITLSYCTHHIEISEMMAYDLGMTDIKAKICLEDIPCKFVFNSNDQHSHRNTLEIESLSVNYKIEFKNNQLRLNDLNKIEKGYFDVKEFLNIFPSILAELRLLTHA